MTIGQRAKYNDNFLPGVTPSLLAAASLGHQRPILCWHRATEKSVDDVISGVLLSCILHIVGEGGECVFVRVVHGRVYDPPERSGTESLTARLKRLRRNLSRSRQKRQRCARS